MIRARALSTLFSVALAVSLALASVGMVVARAEAAGVTEMVICAGGQMGTVSLDPRGNPVDRPHPCPDCAPAVAALIPVTPVVLRPQGRPVAVLPGGSDIAVPGLRLCPMARGPPVSA